MQIFIIGIMEKSQSKQERKRLRLSDFDYSMNGAYFITICTEKKRKILSRVDNVGGDVPDAPPRIFLLDCGEIADKYINQINNFYSDIEICKYVIMPNHIHMLLFVQQSGASGTSPPTARQHSVVSKVVSTFKRFFNKEWGANIWQRSFYDHVIRNQQDYDEHIKYIYENPLRWQYDELYFEE